METRWPIDTRNPPLYNPRALGKKFYPPEYSRHRSDAPFLEWGGVNAATLVEKGRGKLEWDFLNKEPEDKVSWPPPLRVVNSIKVFPETRSPAPSKPQVTHLRRAELGTRFFREQHPDLDVPLDILQPLLEEDHLSSGDSAVYDSFLGNRLATFSVKRNDEMSSRELRMLAFVVGETGSCLNVSAFRDNAQTPHQFVSCPVVLKDFKTPILQIVVFPSTTEDSVNIAIRTSVTIYFARLEGRPWFSEGVQSPVNYVEVGVARGYSYMAESDDETEEDEEDNANPRRFMDIIPGGPDGETAEMILIDFAGALWRWRIGLKESELEYLWTAPQYLPSTSTSMVSPFWRLAESGRPGIVFVASSQDVSQVDFRESTVIVISMIKLHHDEGRLTAIAPPMSNILCVCTTTKVLWVDVNQPDLPVLSWAHARHKHESLQLAWVTFQGEPAICLTSERNSLMTIYPIAVSPSSIHVPFPPFTLVLDGTRQHISKLEPRTGMQILRFPIISDDRTSFEVFELTSRCAVFRTRVQAEPDPEPGGELVLWSPEMNRMEALSRASEDDPRVVGPLGKRQTRTFELRVPYEMMFMDERETLELPESEVLASIESFWHDERIPKGHMVTLSDAMRQVARPMQHVRTRFWSEELHSQLIHADPTHQAAFHSISSGAQSHIGIANALDRIYPLDVPLPEGSSDLDGKRYRLCEVARPEGMAEDQPAIQQREDEAVEILARDLATALEVYSARPFKTSLVGDITQAIPPRIEYGFLAPIGIESTEADDQEALKRPRRRKSFDYRPQNATAGSPCDVQMLGPRLLLSEWTIGSDPNNYVYVDPYDDGEEQVDVKPRIQSQKAKTPLPSQRAPPAIAPVKRAPSLPPVRVPPVATVFKPQPLAETAPPIGQIQDQEEIQGRARQSTQPFAGPFGARAVVAGAKKVKKRVGGF